MVHVCRAIFPREVIVNSGGSISAESARRTQRSSSLFFRLKRLQKSSILSGCFRGRHGCQQETHQSEEHGGNIVRVLHCDCWHHRYSTQNRIDTVLRTVSMHVPMNIRLRNSYKILHSPCLELWHVFKVRVTFIIVLGGVSTA